MQQPRVDASDVLFQFAKFVQRGFERGLFSSENKDANFTDFYPESDRRLTDLLLEVCVCCCFAVDNTHATNAKKQCFKDGGVGVFSELQLYFGFVAFASFDWRRTYDKEPITKRFLDEIAYDHPSRHEVLCMPNSPFAAETGIFAGDIARAVIKVAQLTDQVRPVETKALYRWLVEVSFYRFAISVY